MNENFDLWAYDFFTVSLQKPEINISLLWAFCNSNSTVAFHKLYSVVRGILQWVGRHIFLQGKVCE